MDSAQKSLIKLREGYQKHKNGNDDIEQSEIEEYEKRFLDAINDDINMPIAMSVVWDVIKNPKKSKKFANLLLKFDKVLGIDIDKNVEISIEISQEINELIEKRQKARELKDWVESDKIRDMIKEKGYEIKDTKDGVKINKI